MTLRSSSPARFLARILVGLVLVLPLTSLFSRPTPAYAAANMAVGGSTTVNVGDTVNIPITVNTGGQSANAFQATFTYPASLFDGVRGTYSGSICTLPITQPEPDGGSASFSCGRPSGYTGSGTVATIVLTAKAAGTGSFGLTGCQVLANDGQGTNITGGCSGHSVTTSGATPPPATAAPNTPTPAGSTPTPAGGGTKATPTPKTSKSPTPTPSVSPKVTPTPDTRPGVAVEQANTAEAPTDPNAPPVQELGAPTPTPTIDSNQPSPTPEPDEPREKRNIGQAMRDIMTSIKDLPKLAGNISGLIALLVALIPFLALVFAIMLMGYRLYLLERRRRRTLDRLFEMELSELAALEGKLDLLAEKGSKGREQYREEFKKAKENILRQLKPDFAKPVEAAAAPAAPKE